MPLFKRTKPRLYLALYARAKYPDSYHCALMVCPSGQIPPRATSPTITKHHVKNTLQNNDGTISQPWIYEVTPIKDPSQESRILVRIVFAKIIMPIEHVNRILRDVPIYQVDDASGHGQAFDCVEWVRLAVENLRSHGALGEATLSWDIIREQSLRYVDFKKEQRRWQVGWKGGTIEHVATLDLLTSKEIYP